ncbi:S-adenosyl-L-methionine-dependent methyltransferase [Lipomyces arxii]|uniref:S-adenosyl-L-methionine-dependent methyltransferase n=1 Tax=Lipomyces arxii TaxID=56418 RepID=UPI0034CE0032
MKTQLPKPKIKTNASRFVSPPPRLQRTRQTSPLVDNDKLSPEELKARKRKFLGVFLVSYSAILAGSYYYFNWGLATDGPYQKPVPQDTKPIYEKLAKNYDSIINRDELFMLLPLWRRSVAGKAKGDVLEVSCGTGRNVNYLDIPQIKSMTFVDASESMIELTKEKFTERYPKYQNVEFIADMTENLSTDKKYDVIYETFGLCSYKDPVAALMHLQDLLKPGGQIILLEHGSGTWDFINRVLDKHAVRHSLRYGCRWNLNIGQIVRDSGLVIDSESRSHLGTTWSITAHRAGDDLPKPQKQRFLIW